MMVRFRVGTDGNDTLIVVPIGTGFLDEEGFQEDM